MTTVHPLDQTAFYTILESVNSSELIGQLHPVSDRSSPCHEREATAVYGGELDVGGKQIAIHVGLDADFPVTLPIICVVNLDDVGHIPHVELDGYICYIQTEGLLLDRRNPVGIIEDAIKLAATTLNNGLTGANVYDFVDEFEAYWRRNKQCLRCDSFVEPTDEVREVIFMRRGSPHEEYIYAADDEHSVAAFDSTRTKQFTIVNGLYVPLQKHSLVLPPAPTSFWSVEELRAVVRRNLSSANMNRLDKLTEKHKYEEVIILKIPRPKGGEVMVGVRCLDVEYAHPLHPAGNAKYLTPIVFKRKDKEFLLPRGGAHNSLTAKHVAIVGCGSVGGNIATELVRLGVLRLTLIDPQTMTTENIFRHVTGKTAIGKNKAVALRDDLRQRFPYTSIRSYQTFVNIAIEVGLFRPEDYDLIIIAIGEPTPSLFLNQYFYESHNSPPVIYTWLEAYGIGGHALLTLNKRRKGCLECLYTPLRDNEKICDRSSFAASGQSFAKDLSGCAGLFTPFSSLDAVRTATLAVELAVNTLAGKTEGNPLLSWKGNKDAFVDAGYVLSDRYNLLLEKLDEYKYAHPNPRCPVCGNEQ